MHTVKGIPASKGIAIGPVFSYQPSIKIPDHKRVQNPQDELSRLNHAIQTVSKKLNEVYMEAITRVGNDAAEIFHAHLLMLQDPDLFETAKQKILNEHLNADAAFYDSADEYIQVLQTLPDEYLRQRAADVTDVVNQVINVLGGQQLSQNQISRPVIITAKDLTPSDTMKLDINLVLGFCTADGGTTSHTAILARALGLPAIVGIGQLLPDYSSETVAILDGDNGILIIEPDEQTLQKFQHLQQTRSGKAYQLEEASHLPALTRDNKKITVAANIGNSTDAEKAICKGAEGVGLLRTEFLFIEGNHIPDEEEMVKAYSSLFKYFGNDTVVIRTLDIGGDKEVPHLGLQKESNSFLGCRGIRFCFSHIDLFKFQLRAILQAGINTKLCIMFPMIADISEVRRARAILNECMTELEKEKKSFNQTPQIGIMIEVPAAAICADQLAKEVDFFSIGTNDLIQYTMAADRTNASLNYLASAFQPAVLRLLKSVIEKAHAQGIWVGMCGEMAGEPLAIPILLGLGLDEFSMNPPAIPEAKEIIRSWDSCQAAFLAEKAINCETPSEVRELVENWPNFQK